MGNGTWAKGYHINIEDRDEVPWGMGHNGAHGQWGWAIGHMIITSLNCMIFTKILLHIDIDVFYRFLWPEFIVILMFL